jgi:hypothetical protein
MHKIQGASKAENAGYAWETRTHKGDVPALVTRASKVYIRRLKTATLAVKIEAERGFIRGVYCSIISKQVIEGMKA